MRKRSGNNWETIGKERKKENIRAAPPGPRVAPDHKLGVAAGEVDDGVKLKVPPTSCAAAVEPQQDGLVAAVGTSVEPQHIVND